MPHTPLERLLRAFRRPPRPAHPDGTPYSYAEMTAEGWELCDGCRTWSTATPQHPHQCRETRMTGPVTGDA